MPAKSLFRRHHVHDVLLLLAMAGAWHASTLSLAVGGGLFAFGLLFSAWSKLVLNRNSELITRGPYAICRHPFYLGNAVMDVGMCVMAGYPWLLVLFPVLFHVGYRRTFAYEEAQLKEWFPESHAQFSSTTPLVLPLGTRIFRDWRIGVSPRRIFSEHIASRSSRHLAYPVLILLASRLWAEPIDDWLNPVNAALLATVFALRILSSVFLSEFEAENEKQRDSAWVSGLKNHPLKAFGALVFFAVFMWEGGTLAGAIEALPWGFGMVFAELVIQHFGHRFSRATNRWATLLAGCVFGMGLMVFFDAAYLLPVAFALIVCRVALPPSRRFHFWLPGKRIPAIAGAGLLASISLIAVEIHLDGLVLGRLASHLDRVVQANDWVVVLQDNRLASLKGRTRIDDEVTSQELAVLLARAATSEKRLVVVFDAADVDQLPAYASRHVLSETMIGRGADTFCILIK